MIEQINKSEDWLVTFVNIEKSVLSFLSILVMMLMVIVVVVLIVMDALEHNCEVVVIAQVTCLDVYPEYLSMIIDSLHPHFFNMWIFVLIVKPVLDVMVHFSEMMVEMIINNIDLITHLLLSSASDIIML